MEKSPPPAIPATRDEWIAFCDRLNAAGMAIFSGASVAITEKQFAEPKVLALALLCRTLSHLKGLVAVAKLGLAVEARLLARACYENMFCIGGLVEKGDEFVADMYDDEIRSLRSRGQFVLDKVAPQEGQGAEFTDKLRSRLEEMKARRPKAKLLNPKDAAGQSVMAQGYLFYSQLSGDSAHPSVTALKRHLLIIQENGENVACLDIQPLERGDEIAQTIDIACNAILGVVVGVNQLLDVADARERVRAVFEEYGVLSHIIRPDDAPVKKNE